MHVAVHESVDGPARRLVRRSDMSGVGCKPEVLPHVGNDANDPSRKSIVRCTSRVICARCEADKDVRRNCGGELQQSSAEMPAGK